MRGLTLAEEKCYTLFHMPLAEKSLSWILKGGLLLTPFLVFVVTRSMYFPFITGKNFWFRILVEGLAALWIWGMLAYPRLRPRFSPVVWAVVAFTAVMGIATMFALSPYHSFWSSYERMEGYLGLLHLGAYFLILVSVFRTERDWKVFFSTSIGASVLVSLYAVMQLAGKFDIHQGGTRVDATFGNATYLAAYLLFHMFFLIWFYLRTENVWWRVGFALAFLLEGFILFHTATRGAMLGFLGGILVFGALLALLGRGGLRKIAFVGVGVAVLIPILFFALKDMSFIRENEVLVRFASISPSETTTQSRFTIWRMALRGAAERPILGWGQESFIYVFSKYYEPPLWRQEPWFDRAHNVFLDWLTAGGVLGLAAYLSMFAAALGMLWRALRRNRVDVITACFFGALLAAHFFQIMFVFDNLTSYLLFFAVLAAIHAMTRGAAGKRVGQGGFLASPAPGMARGFAGVALAIGLVAAIYIVNVKPMRAAAAILASLQVNQTAAPAGKVDRLIETFRIGISQNTFGTRELREQLSQVSAAMGSDTAIADQDRQKFFDFAIRELEAQRAAEPTDVRAMAFLATLYATAGRPKDAVALANEALAISDKRIPFYFIAAEAYTNAGDVERALAALKTAYDLAPDYPEAVKNYAIILILAEKDAAAEALFEKHYRTKTPGTQAFAEAYARRNRFDKAVAIVEAIASASPTSAEAAANLGSMYFRAGRPNDAIRAFEEAIRLEPRFKQQGEDIIRQIRAASGR